MDCSWAGKPKGRKEINRTELTYNYSTDWWWPIPFFYCLQLIILYTFASSAQTDVALVTYSKKLLSAIDTLCWFVEKFLLDDYLIPFWTASILVVQSVLDVFLVRKQLLYDPSLKAVVHNFPSSLCMQKHFQDILSRSHSFREFNWSLWNQWKRDVNAIFKLITVIKIYLITKSN